MQIGILGSGNVGGALGTAWAKRGHAVIFGFRDPAKAEAVELAKASGAKAASQTDAAKAEVILVSLPWPATKSVLSALDLKGKIVLDATNPIKADFSGLEAGTDNSGGELVASWAAGARVVKIFNSTGYANMADPSYDGQPSFMPYCGDDAEAKKIAHQLATEIGFDAQDLGPLKNARYLEPLAMVWITLAFAGLGRDIAFRLARR